MMKKNILLTPGPITTTNEVKHALLIPDECPREKKFGDTISKIRKDLVKLAEGDDNYTAVLFTSSGTGCMEAVVKSIDTQGKKILILSNGIYGNRFEEIAQSLNVETIFIKCPYDKELNIVNIQKQIEKYHNEIVAVFVTHHETTTGVLNPIEEIGSIVKDYNLKYVVDAISSFGGIPFSVKACHIDYLISTSNKCLQGLPGISFIIVNRRNLIKRMKGLFYFNIYNQYINLEKHNQFPFTPSVQIIYALQKAIEELFEETIKGRHKRYTENYSFLKREMGNLGFKMFLKDNVKQSKLLLTFLKSDNFPAFHNFLLKHSYTIYDGIIANTFRLGCIGNINKTELQLFIDLTRMYISKLGDRSISMKRIDAIREIMKEITDELVISSTGRISREVYNIRDRARNFYIMGSMGASLGIGIGVALHTKQTVHVISGDGDILMSLSTLVLMNKLRLPNLFLTILDNNCFETTGGQKTCSNAIDFNNICSQNCEVIKVNTLRSDVPRIDLSPKTIMERFCNEVIKRY